MRRRRSASRPSCRGQASTEYLGVVALVVGAALGLGALLISTGAASAVAEAIAGVLARPAAARPRPLTFEQTTPATQALVLAALETGSGAELRDARLVLTAELGLEAARRELDRIAYARLESRAEASNEHYLMSVRPSAHGTIHIVAAVEEQRARAALARARDAGARATLALDLTLSGISALVPEAWPLIVAAAGANAASAGAPGGHDPAGTREGDAILCVPTLITDREHVLGLDEFRQRRNDPALRTEPNGQTTLAIVLVVVRAGRVRWWERHDAPFCA